MEALLSVAAQPGMRYPAADDAFAPDEAYPEYRWDAVSARPNPVYAAVRRVLEQAGLDRARLGTPEWNPLGGYIAPGARVFILCNFVYHRRPHESEEEFASKCTHGAVLRAVADYVLIAAGPEGRVEFGNAPVQSADWERVLRDTGADVVRDFYRSAGAPVEARDLRLFVAARTASGGIARVEDRSAGDAPVEVDLGARSLLAELGPGARFRVSDYDPRRTESYHADGRHVYAISRRVLAADVVVSLPKLKTHEKVGITCGLKGFVGAVALKDCLAHHRMGAPGSGGDEYPAESLPLRAISRLHEWLQRRDPRARSLNPLRAADRVLRVGAMRAGGTLGGAWHGNDTAWRMALDIARILRHADAGGALHPEPVRGHLLFVDGVVGGEGSGPLSPSPVESGAVVFCDDVAVGDLACAELMRFDPARVPLLREAFRAGDLPVTDADPRRARIVADGRPGDWAAIARLAARAYEPPRGWRGAVEARPAA